MKLFNRRANRWRRAQNKEQTVIIQHGASQVIANSKLDAARRQSLLLELINITRSTVDGLKSKTLLEVGGAYFAGIAAETIPDIGAMALDPLINVYLGDCHNSADKCEYIQGQAESIPLKDISVDICICRNAIDHMRSPGKALQEIRRVLKTGGRLYMSCNVYHGWSRPFFPLFDLIDSPHPHHYCQSSFINILKRNNFQIDFVFPADKINKRSFKSFAGKVFGLRHLGLHCSVAGK